MSEEDRRIILDLRAALKHAQEEADGLGAMLMSVQLDSIDMRTALATEGLLAEPAGGVVAFLWRVREFCAYESGVDMARVVVQRAIQLVCSEPATEENLS